MELDPGTAPKVLKIVIFLAPKVQTSWTNARLIFAVLCNSSSYLHPVAVLRGGQRGPWPPPEIFLAPSLAPPLFKEDIMSFLDFLILYRGKSRVSASGSLVDGLAFLRG